MQNDMQKTREKKEEEEKKKTLEKNMKKMDEGPPQPGQPFKFTVSESCDRIKEEFNFLQAQYHNAKMEVEKLIQEKTEMQRHYVMYYEMSYGLNVEMHKQTEIAKRLNAIIVQIMPFLSQEHQQQVATRPGESQTSHHDRTQCYYWATKARLTSTAADCMDTPDCSSCPSKDKCKTDEKPPRCYTNSLTLTWVKKFGSCYWA
ncbi:hypothetical protein M8J75_013928 [Diaphorina citri]|nr:hypothetical protein M8J75_013928 [Diaphorina citri]